MQKKKFLAALERYMEAEWRSVPYVILVVMLQLVIEEWLVAHYSLSRSTAFRLSAAVVLLAYFIYAVIYRAIHRKRDLRNS